MIELFDGDWFDNILKTLESLPENPFHFLGNNLGVNEVG